MALIKAIFKSFKMNKYRWASVEFKDGSVLCGVVTEDIWERLKSAQFNSGGESDGL